MKLLCKLFGHKWENIIKSKECFILKDKVVISEYNQVIGIKCSRCGIIDKNFRL